MATTQGGAAAGQLKDALAQHADKMMGLKLSHLKKRALASGISQEAIEATVSGADDKDDAKGTLISLILKSLCMKATPSPSRGRQPTEEDLFAASCHVCPGCIRPPGHEGPCIDGHCNDIMPESPKRAPALDVEAEVARHKVVKEGVLLKVQQKAAAEEEAQRKAVEAAQKKAAEEEVLRKLAEEARLKAARAEEEALQKAAEEAALQKAAEEAARQKAAEEEARQKAAEEEEALQKAAQEEAQRKAAEEEEQFERKAAAARARQQAEEEAMDKRCVETFLDCVNACSWRERIRTPIKGTILYTKHVRPCRPAGTSVDVKDSSFRFLGNFLKFLEGEGLLSLKPGLTDPVVTDINLDACRKYVYAPQLPTDKAEVDAGSEAGRPAGGLLGRLTQVASSMRWQ